MQSKSTSRKELIRAIIFLVIALATLGLLIIALGGVRFWEEVDNYVIRFDSVKNLSVGRPVKYQGIQAGRVSAIGVDPEDPGTIRVVISIESNFPLYDGTVARISQQGLVGDNFIFLKLEGEPGEVLEPGSTIPAESVPDMNAVVAKIGSTIEDLGPRIRRIAENIELFVSRDNSENLRKTIAKAPELMNKMESSMDEIKKTVDIMQKDWSNLADAAAAGIGEGRKSLKTVGSDVSATLDDLRLAVDSATSNWNRTLDVTRKHIDDTGENVSEFTAKLNEDWDYDQERIEAVLDNLTELTRELKQLSRSIRERPWQIIRTPKEGELP